MNRVSEGCGMRGPDFAMPQVVLIRDHFSAASSHAGLHRVRVGGRLHSTQQVVSCT